MKHREVDDDDEMMVKKRRLLLAIGIYIYTIYLVCILHTVHTDTLILCFW